MQNGWYTVGEGDFFSLDQGQQHLRKVASRVDLLDAQGRGHIRDAPGMDVKHRGKRHIDITTMEALMGDRTRQRPKHGQSVQHQLWMTIIDSFRITVRASRIESRCPG